MIEDETLTIAFGILLAGMLFCLMADCHSNRTGETEQPSYRQGVNCGEKKQGARPACWKSHDWQAYCQNTGNCRGGR